MRELELSMSEMLKNGLAPERSPLGAQYLNECYGFKCGKFWLEGYDPLDNPIDPAFNILYYWPFPQFLNGDKYNILVIRDMVAASDKVYTLDDYHGTVTLISTLAHGVYGLGSLPELADFGKYAMIVNGPALIYRNVATSTWVTVAGTTKIPQMRTICNFKGQAVGGNIISSWYDCNETYIVWSKIGEADFTPDEKNTAGYRRDPFGGHVLHARQLGDTVIIYSSAGITSMIPVIEPAATFGFKELSDVGLINRGAVNGSKFKHVFVDAYRNLCELSKEGLKVLGYQEYLQRLTENDVIVSYAPFTKDFYISDGTTTFLYSPYGLTEVPQHPSTVWAQNDSLGVTGQYMLPDTVESGNYFLQTCPFDFGYRDSKTLFVTELGIDYYDTAEMSIYWKIDNGSYTATPWLMTNKNNIATRIVNGTDFMIGVRVTGVDENTVFSYIKCRYKMTDLKSIRGIYAPPPRGQQG
jgi:hypothetical protein